MALKKGKIIKRAGAVLAAAVVAVGVAKVGMGIGEDRAIGKYIDEKYSGDKGNIKLVDVLVEDLNEDNPEGVEYEDPQFRGMIVDDNIMSSKSPVKVYFVAEETETKKPYMIKATIENQNFAVSGESDKNGEFNPNVIKNNIIEGVQEKKLEIVYDYVETSPEIMKLLDEMGKYESIVNSPEKENQHLKASVIVGYTVDEKKDGTFEVTVVSNVHAIELDGGIISSEKSTYANKQISFTVDSEEEILERLLKLSLSEEKFEVKYSKAGVTVESQGKAYEAPQSEEGMGMN